MIRRLSLTAPLPALLVAVWTAAAGASGGTIKGTITSAAGKGETVADAVVLVEGATLGSRPPAGHAVMDQRGDTFVPHVLGIGAGTTVDFPNSDPGLHNIYSTSAAKKFDLGMYNQGESKSVTFETPGVVHVRCNVHPKMEAVIVVHSNPYVAVTDAHGSFAVNDIPPGEYTVRVWHERLGEERVPVTVREGGIQPLDVRLREH
jgi:plastocyanin